MRQMVRKVAAKVVYDIAKRLGIAWALGSDRHARLALWWQICARVIDQGSRLSAVRLAGSHDEAKVTLPAVLPSNGVVVATRKKLPNNRQSK